MNLMQQEDDLQVIAPTKDDPVIHPNAERLGGPVGWSAGISASWWTPLRVVIVLGTFGFLAGLATKIPCITTGWTDPGRYTHLCYSDIPPLYSLRGFADGVFPYLSTPLPGQEQLEYPVITGLFMALAGWLTPDGDNTILWFFLVNAILLSVCALVTVAATSLTVRRRPWDAAMVALAPGFILCATINWDLIALAFTAVALALWSRRHPALAGIFLGLATASKFYPAMLLGPILILCFRAHRMKAFWYCLGGAALSWLVVNVPFMIANFDGWWRFYEFSKERGEDFGSIWLVFTNLGHTVSPDALNTLAAALFLILCIGIAAIGLFASRRPRLAQLCFLVVAAFLLTNKVYSPQFVLWLIPLAALARPRWRDFLIWQTGEFLYYAAIWLYLAGFDESSKGLPVGWYTVAILVHVGATLYFALMIIRDIFRPEYDPIRTDQFADDRDDPGGGVLDFAPSGRRLFATGSASSPVASVDS